MIPLWSRRPGKPPCKNQTTKPGSKGYLFAAKRLGYAGCGSFVDTDCLTPGTNLNHGCCWQTFHIFAHCGLEVEIQPLNCYLFFNFCSPSHVNQVIVPCLLEQLIGEARMLDGAMRS